MNVQLSSQPLPDLRWKPSQGITFHNSTTTRTYATKGATPRTTASYGAGPPRKSSLLTAASATSKNTRNSVPVLPYIPRKPSTTQIAEFAPEQDHHTVERGFVDLGNDFDTLGQALADAGVGEYGAKDQTWNTWEPINFITEASTAGMQDVSLSVKLAEKKQVAAQREKDLQMARDLAAQLEEQAFKVAARKEEKARQVASQREIESRKALLASQAVANVGSTDPRENIGVLALDTTNGIVSWGELARRDALLRKELEKAEQEAAAAKALRSRLDASYKAKLLNQTYKAIKELFEPAAAGYGKLIDALTQSQDDYPQLTICWIRNISELREEFRKYAHQYREIVRLRKSRDYTVTTEGKRPTQTSAVWRRRVRNYYLESPFNEQDVFASMSMQAMYSVSPLRHQQGLRRLLDPVKLQRNTRALRVAGLNFIAGVKEKDALEFDWADQESHRMLDPILNGLKKLQPLCNQLRSLRRFWLKEYQGHDGISARPARLGLWQCSFDLEKNLAFIKEHVNEAEEAVEKRVERQLLKRAQERSPVLLSKYSPSVSDSQSHHKSQELNLRPTAMRNQVFFVGSDLVKQRTSATEDQDPIPSSLNPALPNPDQVQPPVSFHIPEDVKRQAILASSSPGTTYWKYTMYQNPDGEKVTVHYCKSKEASERIAKLFLDKPVIGFDIEWKPQASALEGTKKNVSLIQLASEERIALFHIARYGKDGTIDDLVAPTLKKIMESPEITKVGVAVKADCTRLRKFMGIGSRGLLELSHLYKLVKFSSGDVKKINKSLVALAQQVEEHFQLPMWKGEVRSSDWSEELNFEQIQCECPRAYVYLPQLIVIQTLHQTRTLVCSCTM